MHDKMHNFYLQKAGGMFYKTISLHEQKLEWDTIIKDIPLLPRGWYELSRLSKDDRIEFTRDYWLAKLPLLCPHQKNSYEKQIISFFDHVDDLGIFATQLSPTSFFEVHMVYGLKDDVDFFHGSPPASIDTIDVLKKQFANFTLPSDYLAFLEIHDGFSRYIDTGLIKCREMPKMYFKFQQRISQEIIINSEGESVNPTHLIPFYESQRLHSYQCFWADWYPEEEMGNIAFFERDEATALFSEEHSLEIARAYTSFLQWFLHYLEGLI